MNIDLLLENQNLANEKCNYENFKSLFLQLVEKVFKDILLTEWVGCQVHSSPTNFFGGKRCFTKTRALKVILPNVNKINVDVEDCLAVTISNELCREVVSDLRNNCTKVELRSNLSPGQAVQKVAKKIRANWLICSPETLKLFSCLTSQEDCLLSSVGDFGKIKVYCDRLFPDKEILLGHKSEEEFGYSFNPYVPFTLLGPIVNPESFEERFGIHFRYFKYLQDKNHYRLLKL